MRMKNSITFDIGLKVSGETAAMCAKLLEIYINSNPDVKLEGEKVLTDDGYKTIIKLERNER